MSFRRIPFQFSSTDPVERQAELEKRFGLPSKNKMYVDAANPLSKSFGNNLFSNSSSPRLQHRVPIFVEGYDKPVKSSVDSQSSNCDAKKANVRVIPTEIEGAEARPSTRLRTFSGPAGYDKEQFVHEREDVSPLKRSMQDLSKPTKMKASAEPVVHNIPIKRNNSANSPAKPEKVTKSRLKDNGCGVSKSPIKVKSKNEPKTESTTEQKVESGIIVPFKKIENVLEELKTYESGVQEFNGTMRDKQYRYLDEMLTRCMLRLDDIDTMGNDKVRSARKNAVKKVQACVDLLETKISKEPEVLKNLAESKLKNTEMQSNDQLHKDVNMKESDTEAGNKIGDDKVVSSRQVKVEMTENNEAQIDKPVVTAEVPSESSAVQMTEVESAFQDNSDITDQNKQMTVESKLVRSEVSEVEMVEVKGVSVISIDSSANEVQDVDMIENKPNEHVVAIPVQLSSVASEVDKATVIDSKTLTSFDLLCPENKSDINMEDVQNKSDEQEYSEISKSEHRMSSPPVNRQNFVDYTNVAEATTDSISKTFKETNKNADDSTQIKNLTEL